MKKSLIVGLLAFVTLLSFASVVLAVHSAEGIHAIPVGVTDTAGLVGIINTATNILFTAFLILAVVFLILAAFQFLTGGGDPEKLGEARGKVIWAVVGIAIALLARGLPAAVQALLKIT